jgi:16S rRNA C1402 (ribose-2'-O) methylase RsmI
MSFSDFIAANPIGRQEPIVNAVKTILEANDIVTVEDLVRMCLLV